MKKTLAFFVVTFGLLLVAGLIEINFALAATAFSVVSEWVASVL